MGKKDGPGPPYLDELRRLLDRGTSYRDAAKILGVGRGGLHAVIKRHGRKRKCDRARGPNGELVRRCGGCGGLVYATTCLACDLRRGRA